MVQFKGTLAEICSLERTGTSGISAKDVIKIKVPKQNNASPTEVDSYPCDPLSGTKRNKQSYYLLAIPNSS